MAKVKNESSSKPSTTKRRKALTPEAREQQLISYAIDLVEQRLLDGTASSQETTHFLKLGSIEARKKLEILEEERKMMIAKRESLESMKNMDQIYKDAIKAMQTYSGNGSSGGEDDNYEDEY